MKKILKGFSLVEVLYTMAIGGAIMAISIPLYQNKIYNDNVIETKENVLLAIRQQQEYYKNNSWFDTVAETEVDSTMGVTGNLGLNFYSKPGSFFQTRPIRCVDGALGLYVQITDDRIANPTLESYFKYNSCTDSRILRPSL